MRDGLTVTVHDNLVGDRTFRLLDDTRVEITNLDGRKRFVDRDAAEMILRRIEFSNAVTEADKNGV